MSLASWKKEFYRTPANRVSKRYAIQHSLKKWIGLKSSNKKRHSVFLEDISLVDEKDNFLPFGDSTCALCYHYDNCTDCPLVAANKGRKCHDTGQPYNVFIDTYRIGPMIKLLRKALKET